MATIYDIMGLAEVASSDPVTRYGQVGHLEATLVEAQGLLDLCRLHVADAQRDYARYWATLERLVGLPAFARAPRQAPPGTIGTPEQFEADLDAEHDERDHREAVRAALLAKYPSEDAESLWRGLVALGDEVTSWEKRAVVAATLVELREPQQPWP